MNEIGYLGLGSNVGDRRLNLQATVESLWTHDVVVLLSSSVYETEPVGEVLEQRSFYNAVLRVETRLGPERLLDACKAVERAFGRKLDGEDGYVKHGPRAIDVDLLLLGAVEYTSERLVLPHREVMTRRFVLVPLLELDPELAVPGRGPCRTPPGSRPSARSTALHASSRSSGPSSVSTRTHALKKSRWSSTSPTGSVSYTLEEARTMTPCVHRSSIAACRLSRRSPTFEPRPR